MIPVNERTFIVSDAEDEQRVVVTGFFSERQVEDRCHEDYDYKKGAADGKEGVELREFYFDCDTIILLIHF